MLRHQQYLNNIKQIDMSYGSVKSQYVCVETVFRFVRRIGLSLFLKLFKLLVLNYLVATHCSLQLFLSSGLNVKQHSPISLYVQLQYVLMWHTQSSIFSCTFAPHLEMHLYGTNSSFCQANPFYFGAKLKPVLGELGLDSVRCNCLMCHPWP